MMVVTCLGIFFNIISIFYFANLTHQRTFYRLMLQLAVIDTLFLLFSALTFTLPHFNETYASYYWMYLVPYTLPIAQTCMTSSVYMTVSLTLERFFSVVHPLYQLRKRWLKSSVALSLPGIIFSILFTLPNYFQMETVWREAMSTVLSNDSHVFHNIGGLPHLNSTLLTQLSRTNESLVVHEESHFYISVWNETTFLVPVDEETVFHLQLVNETLFLLETPYLDIDFAPFRDNGLYIKIYVMWLHLIFNLLIPLSLMGYLNHAIYKKLHQIPKRAAQRLSESSSCGNNNMILRRSTDSKLRKRERRLARISLLIVLIFIICHSVKNIPTVFEIFGEDPRDVPVCSHIMLISHLLLSFNSSVNFLVYSAGSSRKIFRIIIGTVSKSFLTERILHPNTDVQNNSNYINHELISLTTNRSSCRRSETSENREIYVGQGKLRSSWRQQQTVEELASSCSP